MSWSGAAFVRAVCHCWYISRAQLFKVSFRFRICASHTPSFVCKCRGLSRGSKGVEDIDVSKGLYMIMVYARGSHGFVLPSVFRRGGQVQERHRFKDH